MSFFDDVINEKILQISTNYLAKVIGVDGQNARLQPLTMSKAINGKSQKQSTTTALIPNGIKCKEKQITYLVSETKSETLTVLAPDHLAVGDIVLVGVCDRDITYAKNGEIREATSRHHDSNDGVIVRFVR